MAADNPDEELPKPALTLAQDKRSQEAVRRTLPTLPLPLLVTAAKLLGIRQKKKKPPLVTVELSTIRTRVKKLHGQNQCLSHDVSRKKKGQW